MPENRVHHAAACRIAVNSGRNRKAAELHAEGKPANPLVIVVCLTILLFAAVLGRLGYLQLFRHSEYMAKAQRQQQHVIEITPKRGAIYDRNMHPLAMSIPVDSAFAVPSELGDQQLAARLLSGVRASSRRIKRKRWRR
jgi:cell division protein FtsI/penicillin-binding protein 2